MKTLTSYVDLTGFKIVNTSLLTLSSAFLISCSETQKLDDMRDTTKEMKTITEEMRDTTKGVGETAKSTDAKMEKQLVISEGMHTDMKAVLTQATNTHSEIKEMKVTGEDVAIKMEQMKSMGTEDGARAARIESFEHLISDKTMLGKLKFAGQYEAAFEFQFWNPDNRDESENDRLTQAQGAAKEYMSDVTKLMEKAEQTSNEEFAYDTAGYLGFLVEPFLSQDGDKAEIDPQTSADENNELMSLHAIAATMHILSPYQEKMLKTHKNTQAMSLYSIIVQALSLKKTLAATTASVDQTRGFVKEVLAYENQAVSLLQLRHNMFLAMALKQSMAASGYSSTVKKGLAMTWGWTLDLGNLNPAQLAKIKRYTILCLATIRDLKKVDVVPETRQRSLVVTDLPEFIHLINKMKVTETTTNDLQSEIVVNFKKIAEELQPE